MDCNTIRKTFLDFFQSKQHEVMPSAPIVVKNDPTLMFINAGMNQFKDIFLGNSAIRHNRVCNSQKCLRVSGKHNDLEEVGRDTYHHTMFEMLGNWSFGDYFKKEAIAWAWELLTKVFKISKDRLYVTIFEGDNQDGTARDTEAYDYWRQFVSEEKILNGSKKDNFWEMGDTGPCGPCSEIHIDLRSKQEQNEINGKDLINKDHPLVIEIWNLVFIEYNRKANGQLECLPMKHIDTGMGFERLCMVLQDKQSNYDTDVFQPIIEKIANLTGIPYGKAPDSDIAMRVIADHLRAIAFSIADGQLPSNVKAGYVIRRILRRAVRYAYTFLNINEPFINKLIPTLIQSMGNAFTELQKQQQIIEKVITEEETAFLRTLERGIHLLDDIMKQAEQKNVKVISGKSAFKLYDSFGFPLDLTELILREHNLTLNKREFDEEMQAQKARAKSAATTDKGDWIVVSETDEQPFTGYDSLEDTVEIVRYRKLKTKKKELYQLVFNHTPFYAESGGQVGDTGYIETKDEKIDIVDTKKENNLTVHITKKLPKSIASGFKAVVNNRKRFQTARNHSATHLLHQALREIIGSHVEQKGSLVEPEYLRFDFSHFQKLTEDELLEIENFVNRKIRANIPLNERREVTKDEANKLGAIALFGEKYGESVRVVQFDNSVELCGGTHVSATGEIGLLKIKKETAIAAGIRRIEAVTGNEAEKWINEKLQTLHLIENLFKNPTGLVDNIQKLINENNSLKKKIENYEKENVKNIKQTLKNQILSIQNINVIAKKIDMDSPASIKDLAYQLKGEVENLFLIVGAEIKGKANLTIMISENLVETKKLHAGNIIRTVAKEIQGGGGGQPFFATAGGKNPNGIDAAIQKALDTIKTLKIK